MAPEPSFFILPAAGVAAAVFAVWATTRGRVDKLDAAAAAAAISADLMIEPPTEVYLDRGGRSAFAPVEGGVAVAWRSGGRIAVRSLSPAEIRALRREPGEAGRVRATLVTRDFDRPTFIADLDEAQARALAAAIAAPDQERAA